MRFLHPAGARATAFLAAFVLAASAHADAQPAQKDTPARGKPKAAEVTATIEPARAAPGDTVKLLVRAKLQPGWHIYTVAEKQREEGPRHTLFDVFDLAGIEKAGDWTADRDAKAAPEPAFGNNVFEYYEDEVVWSLPLKVPADAAPGEKSIQVQASYQLCNASSCTFPGRWTLPAATLTVAGEAAAAPPASSATPKKKDSPERLRPKGVTITPTVSPAVARPGDVVKYTVAVKLDPGLHIYNVARPGAGGGNGPDPTSFNLFDLGGLAAGDEWTPAADPIVKPEPAFGDDVLTEFFEDEAAWTVALTVPADAAPGDHVVRSQISYQICNENACFPPTHQTLADVVVKVEGVAAAPAPTAVETAHVEPSAPAPEATEPAPAVAPEPPAPAVAVEPSAPAEAPSESASIAAAPADAGPTSEIARTARESLWGFLLLSAAGGLLALAMPCVWPMVPITVNFFVKQGERSGKGGTTGLAVTYCLAIIGVFTAVGVLFSFLFSSTFLQNLANNPWLNLFVAALFLAFGLSLLGLFEIRLPSFLLNASARGESRGGLIGVIFMALTLTITSFTCTFPVVGGLLVMAANGDLLYPILGLATFSSVIALPFFALALAPGLLQKMPRSGDWMNSVKVVGGLVEIGAALKFLNTAELGWVTPENAWFDAQVVLTAWIVLSAVCGLYLLGFFRTNHDYDEAKVGPGRMVFGCAFLGLALYMAPGLFGRPPMGLVWDRLIVGILPADSHELTADVRMAAADPGEGPVKATSTDPEEAQREQKNLHGVLWGMSLDKAREEAAAQNRPILIDFTGVNCANCRLMERRVLPRPDIVKLLQEFVTVQLYTDRVPIDSITSAQREELALENQIRQLDLTAEQTNPFYVIMTPEGEVVASIGGYNEPPVFQDFLVKGLDKAQNGSRVAQTARR
ncbi:protein-disulfide reductase DsbD domain-containing protein [Paludisphaera sp.]|uniref:cytochrome c biogenesis protein CcdA n=1 Tax=Paludisphaera sp. TaxID=2017432 RepID=UPI00301DF533